MLYQKELLRFFHPVLASRALKNKPMPVQIGNEKIVLFRRQDRKIEALRDQCPHRFTPLSEGYVDKNGRLTCPYHGWNFDGHGNGMKPKTTGAGKANCKVTAYQAVEKYGYVWVANQGADPVSIPVYSEEGWTFLESYTFRFEAPFHVVLDNFSEDEHFPFVHKMFGWDESGINDVEFSCEQIEDKVKVSYWGPQRTFLGMRFLLARPGQYLANNWTASFDPVRTVFTTHLTDKEKNLVSPGYNRIAIHFVPVGEKATDLHVFQFVKFENRLWLKVLPFLKPVYVGLIKNDLSQDAVFTRKLVDVPSSFKGMGLGLYDKPLVYGRQLLEKVYYGNTSVAEGNKPAPAAHREVSFADEV